MTHFPKFTIVIFSLTLILAVASCGRKTVISEQMVRERIDAQIPLGSSPQQVLAFLNSFEMNGLKAKNWGYVPEIVPAMDGPVLNEFEGPGHIGARIDKTGKDSSEFQVYSIVMDFFFDKAARLASYKCETRGDW